MKRQKRIESVSIVDQVCDAIKEMIFETPYHPGDRLPSEQEIADTYGVNKLSVRMALQKLCTLGVVEKRNGEGSFVKEFSISPLLVEAADFYTKGSRFEDIQDLRQLLEGDSSAKAAVNATEAEKTELRRLLQDYNTRMSTLLSNHTDANFKALLDADTAFHKQIIRMSHNQLYIDIYTLVLSLVEKHISSLLMAREEALREIVVTQDIHNQLCFAICQGNGDEAERIARRIVDIQEKVGIFN